MQENHSQTLQNSIYMDSRFIQEPLEINILTSRDSTRSTSDLAQDRNTTVTFIYALRVKWE